METCNFYKPESGYEMDDLQQKVMEVVLELHTNVSSLHDASETLFQIGENGFSQASEKELSDFAKVQGALRCLSQLVEENPETISNFLIEREQYKILKQCTETQ